jgi:MoaD family protein
MNIEVFGTLRRITGSKNVRLDLPPGATLRALLHAFVGKYPDLAEIILDESGDPRPDLPLFVNGRNPRLRSESVGMRIKEGDIVCLFSPVSSGRMNVEVLRSDYLESEEAVHES